MIEEIIIMKKKMKWKHKKNSNKNRDQLNLRVPMEGRSGSLMSLILCGMFISFTADTALAGADESPACEVGGGTLSFCNKWVCRVVKR